MCVWHTFTAISSKNNGAMIAVFADIHANLNTCGYAPTLNIMDNKCSKAVKVHIQNNLMDIHLDARLQLAQSTFISALTTVNRNCLPKLWDDFLAQVGLTLNLLLFS
jgi:hypothetical protein